MVVYTAEDSRPLYAYYYIYMLIKEHTDGLLCTIVCVSVYRILPLCQDMIIILLYVIYLRAINAVRVAPQRKGFARIPGLLVHA